MKSLDELERIARAATQGDWNIRHADWTDGGVDLRISKIVADVLPGDAATNAVVETSSNAAPGTSVGDLDMANIEFIAAANPDTVLSLIARLREREKQLDPESMQHWDSMLERLRAAEKALEFYAERAVYQFLGGGLCLAQQDNGDRARAALNPSDPAGGETCEACGGTGEIEYDDQQIIGYADRSMAIDGGDPALEGEPVYGTVRVPAPCPECDPSSQPDPD